MKTLIRADCAVDQQDNQHMIIRIASNSFYSKGDERRLFEGFEEISAIPGVKGVARELLLDIEVAKLSKDAMRGLLALLWRYEIPLAPV